ncbi:MAG: nuclear transport factor 2 family protein, partial [Alphaproteobacteria bacterium]
MTSADDLDQIKALLQAYLDGLYHGDVARLEAAFHPVAHLISA